MRTVESTGLLANPLLRHLAVVLVVKVLLLAALWWLFFRLPDGGVPAYPDVQTHIAGPRGGPVSTLNP